MRGRHRRSMSTRIELLDLRAQAITWQPLPGGPGQPRALLQKELVGHGRAGQPLGCHRPEGIESARFRGLLIRLVTGSSWVDIEADPRTPGLGHHPARARRDEWIAAGVFEMLKTEALAALDRIIGLDLDYVALDGSPVRCAMWWRGTGPNPTDRAADGSGPLPPNAGVPVGWAIDGANRNDVAMLEPTLADVEANGLLAGHRHPAPDWGYDSGAVRIASELSAHQRLRDPAA